LKNLGRSPIVPPLKGAVLVGAVDGLWGRVMGSTKGGKKKKGGLQGAVFFSVRKTRDSSRGWGVGLRRFRLYGGHVQLGRGGMRILLLGGVRVAVAPNWGAPGS